MLVLSNTTNNLQAVLKSAVATSQLEVLCFWSDITTTTFVRDWLGTTTNDTTDVNIVPAPAASTQRVIDSVSVWNRDTADAEVTVKIDVSGTERIFGKWVLATGERLEYGGGRWTVYTATGAEKIVQTSGSTVGALNLVTLASDVINNNAVANTIQDVTGLSFPVVAGETYWFRFMIAYTAALTTTGSRWSINGPAAPTLLNYRSIYTLTATTITTNNATAYDIPAASNATSLTAGNTSWIEGVIKPSSNGTVIARFASEVASSAITAKAGSLLQWVRTL